MKNHPPLSPRHAKGFTLIEVLAVMTIIAILAALSFGGFNAMIKSSNNKATQTRLALIGTKLQEYKLDTGVYPGAAADGDEDSAQILLQELGGLDSAGQKIAGKKVYIAELAQRSKDMTDGETIIDKFGFPLRYRTGDAATNPDFDLWSVGPDGETSLDNPDADDNVDDLRNF